jgi:muramoyltetrapeptide carboxypeptidase
VSAVIPPRVARGATIGIVAPAGPVKLDHLRVGLARLGDAFALRLAPSLTQARAPGVPSYLAASDDVRAAELMAMFADPDVRAIILARGGYGLMRILPRLDPDVLRRDPKPIVGFSDATALLSWAHAAGVRGIHGPMGVQMGSLPEAEIAQTIAMLTEPRPLGVRPWQLASHDRGVHRGALIAANLTLVSVLVGTPWALPLRGSITLLEEVGEKPYELDRYLTHLTLAGELAKPHAMIVGDLTRCVDPHPPTGVPDPEDAALATVLERLRAAGAAVATGAPIGHGARNEPVPFGAACVLDLDRGQLEILDPAVA